MGPAISEVFEGCCHWPRSVRAGQLQAQAPGSGAVGTGGPAPSTMISEMQF